MKTIPLTQGKVAIVDDEDYPNLIKNKWHVQKAKHTYYAVRDISLNNPKEQIHITMHQQIMNTPPGMDIDHHNHKGYDNRKCNLRICSRSRNLANSRKYRKLTSKYKGIHNNKRYKNNWIATIKGKRIGSYKTEIEAAKAYDKAAIKLFGEFAHTNF